MAGQASAGSSKASGDKVTTDELLAQNSELSGQVNALTARVEDLTRAALMGVGIDGALQELTMKRERKPVQFLEHYARASTPSPIQKDKVLIEGYSVAALDVVLLPTDEIERLKDAETVRHVPSANGKTKIEARRLLESDEKKFEPRTRRRYVAMTDGRGRLRYEPTEETETVAELMKKAQAVG